MSPLQKAIPAAAACAAIAAVLGFARVHPAMSLVSLILFALTMVLALLNLIDESDRSA